MNLYAWTNSTYNATFWTDTENPTTSSHIYDSQGNDVTNTYIKFDTSTDSDSSITSASSSSITYYVLWYSPMTTYTTTLPIGVAYSHNGKTK